MTLRGFSCVVTWGLIFHATPTWSNWGAPMAEKRIASICCHVALSCAAVSQSSGGAECSSGLLHQAQLQVAQDMLGARGQAGSRDELAWIESALGR